MYAMKYVHGTHALRKNDPQHENREQGQCSQPTLEDVGRPSVQSLLVLAL